MRLQASCLLFIAICSVPVCATSRPVRKTSIVGMPVTTSSARARTDFERAMQALEEVRMRDTVQQLRAATKEDARFAQAWILLSYFSHDPEERFAAREHAGKLLPHVTPAEKLLIQWLSNAAEDNYIPAIAAMNDLLELCPRDQRLLYLAGGWLSRQQRYSQSIMVLERAIALDPDYAAAVNELAYGYAFTGDFPRAISLMDRYVALQPEQPNPHDSYGEILRMAGKFDAALEQYRESIRLDPNFGSELGVADTLALMGKEEDAREEYARAEVFAADQQQRIEFELASAVTWIREDNRRQAERTVREVAKHAHSAGLARIEAEAHRVLAMYEPDHKNAEKELDSAQKALDEPHQLSPIERDEEHARILMARAVRAVETQADASVFTRELETMASRSRSQVIQAAYHTAAGTQFMAEGKYGEAVSELQENADDPIALRLLWQAYSNAGDRTHADGIAAKLASVNVPSPEQALVVPQFRAQRLSEAKRP